jgi:hypothetical protein
MLKLTGEPTARVVEQVNWDLEIARSEAVSTAYAASPLVRRTLVDAGVTDAGDVPGRA